VTLAVVFVFFAARWRTNNSWAALIALGFGLGTNAWPTASQTLWQHESTLAGLALAVLCLAPPAARLNTGRLWLAAAGLGIAARRAIRSHPRFSSWRSACLHAGGARMMRSRCCPSSPARRP